MRSFFLASAFTALAAAAPTAVTNPVVDAGYAKFKGVANSTSGVTYFNSIYFAASPTGQLRWQAPVAIEKQNPYTSGQVVDATQLGPMCLPQVPGWLNYEGDALPGPNLNVSENCLLLNIKAPYSPASKSLPVMIQIGGGGYTFGATTSAPGDYLVSQSKGQVIYVETQYRTGGLGFLGSSEVRSSGTANAALLDQLAAINWVKSHISAFGGDPTKITIIGNSQGAGAITAQLQLYGGTSSPPFRAAIAQSPFWQPYQPETILETQYQQLLKGASCSDLTCLRGLSFDKLSAALASVMSTGYAQGNYGFGDFYWGPSVDGTIIKELPHSAFNAGRFTRVPMLVDHSGLEGLLFSNTSIASAQNVRSDLQQVWQGANSSFFNQIDQLYPASAFNGSYFQTPVLAATAPGKPVGNYYDPRLPGITADYGKNPYFYKRQQIFGDGIISCNTETIASSMTKYGQSVYKLIYNSGTLWHAAALYSLILDPSTFPTILNAAETATFQAYYISFVTDLNPNTNTAFKSVSRPTWNTYGSTGNNVMFDNFTKFANGADTDCSSRCKYLSSQAGSVLLN